jgi:hypothetical protein
VGRGRKIQCAAARRQILGALARPRRGHQGKSQNPLHFLHHGAVRIYLKGAHRIQGTAPTVLLWKGKFLSRRCRRPNMCKKKAAILPRLVAVPQRQKAGVLPQLCRNPLLLTMSGRERMCTCWSSGDAQIRV